MTDLMQLLYDYTVGYRAPGRLPTEEYRNLQELEMRLDRRLRALLAEDAWDTLQKYQDALEERRRLESEALFLAAFALSGELS